MIWYDMIWYDIWYDIYLLQLGFYSVTVVDTLVLKYESFQYIHSVGGYVFPMDGLVKQ